MDPVLKQPEAVTVAPGDLTGNAPIVVLAPHPDDESLGCGRLLAHAFARHGAHVVCMTDGAASHPGSRAWPPDRLAAERKAELGRAVAHLGGGTGDMSWLGHPDGWLGARDRDRIAGTIVTLCRRTGARRLFAPAPQDHHEDHRTTADIAQRVAHALPGLAVFSYPVWSRWDDVDLLQRVADRQPLRLDTARHRAAKRAAIEAHRTQTGAVILDDPEGFALPRGFVDRFVADPEIFWRAGA